MKLASVEEMRRIEQLTDAGGHSYAEMMEMAGRAVADAALWQGLVRSGEQVLVLVGPGNNGGDGLVAAHYLLAAGQDTVIYIWKRDVEGDANFLRLSPGRNPLRGQGRSCATERRRGPDHSRPAVSALSA